MTLLKTQHQELAAGRWFTMTLAQQLGNVGSDFERALRWKEKNQPKFFTSAVARTLELLDLTMADKRWHNHRLKELSRLRGEVCDILFAHQIDYKSARGLQNYFLSMGRLAKKY